MKRGAAAISRAAFRRAASAASLVVALALTATPALADPPATDVLIGGLDASMTNVTGADRTKARLASFGMSSSHVGFGYEGPLAIRVVNTASLGYGVNRFQGGIDNALAGGVRLALSKNHGIVFRGGIEASFFGNQYLWDSLLELPQFHLGYQWIVPHSVIDVAFKTGYVLDGRHNTGDAVMRELNSSFEVGGIGALHVGPMDIRLTYTRVLVRNGETPIDMLEGAFCGIARKFSVCSAVRYEVGEGILPDLTYRETRASFVGLTFGTYILDRYKKVKKPRQ
jgi:hypothetical protein